MASRNWLWHAEHLRMALRDVPQGGREVLLLDHGHQHGLSVAALRSYMAAVTYLETIEAADPGFADLLRRAPPASIEVIGRWYRRDAPAARQAAQAFLNGGHTTRSLAAAERATREFGHPKLDKEGWRAALLAGPGCLWRDGKPATSNGSDEAHAETRWAHDEGGRFRLPEERDRGFKVDLFAGNIACMLVGPYASQPLYVHRAVDWCLRALGLSRIYTRSALLLPWDCPHEPFRSCLRAVDDGMPHVGAPPGFRSGVLTACADEEGRWSALEAWD